MGRRGYSRRRATLAWIPFISPARATSISTAPGGSGRLADSASSPQENSWLTRTAVVASNPVFSARRSAVLSSTSRMVSIYRLLVSVYRILSFILLDLHLQSRTQVHFSAHPPPRLRFSKR